MDPALRREALVDVTLRLMREHGRDITTKQIAEAAGVAEGTIFRVVETKDELLAAAVQRAFTPGDLVARIEEIDPTQPLEQRLTTLVSIMQQRFRATFALMQKVGMVRPPDHLHDSAEAVAWRARLEALMTDVVGPDAGQLGCPVDHLVHLLRLLTFAGSHDHIADGRLLTPEQVVDTLLHGLLAPRKGDHRC